MTIQAEMRRKIVVSVAAVGVFIAPIVGIGATYNQSGLISTGGPALVGATTAFVPVMADIGVRLLRSS